MEKFQQLLKNRKFILAQIVLLFILTNAILSEFRCRLDLSRNGRFSLTKSTERILKSLPEKLYIDAYYSSEIPPDYKSRIILAQEMLKELASVSPENVTLRFFDPDSSDADKNSALEKSIEPQTLQKVERGGAQVKSAFLGVHLRLGQETDSIPVVFFAEEVEYQILSTVKKMIRKDKGWSSGVALLQEEGSMNAPRPGPSSNKDTFGVFMNQIFASEYGPAFPFSVNFEPLPEDVKVLIVAGSPELREKGKYHLDQFLMNGGKILYLPKTMEFQLDDNSPYGGLGLSRKGFAQVVQNAKDLDDFFSHYGVRVESNLVFDANNSMPMGPIVQMEEGLLGRYHYPLWILATRETGLLSDNSPFTKDLEVLLFPWASGLKVSKENQPLMEYKELAFASANAFTKSDYVFLGEKEVYKTEGEPLGEKIPLIVHAKGKMKSYFNGKELPEGVNEAFYLAESHDNSVGAVNDEPAPIPEILVISSPYVVSDLLVIQDFREIYQGANAPFFLNALDILQGEEDLVESRAKKPAFESLENFSSEEEIFYSIFNIFMIPIIIGLYAYFRLRSRNSKSHGGR